MCVCSPSLWNSLSLIANDSDCYHISPQTSADTHTHLQGLTAATSCHSLSLPPPFFLSSNILSVSLTSVHVTVPLPLTSLCLSVPHFPPPLFVTELFSYFFSLTQVVGKGLIYPHPTSFYTYLYILFYTHPSVTRWLTVFYHLSSPTLCFPGMFSRSKSILKSNKPQPYSSHLLDLPSNLRPPFLFPTSHFSLFLPLLSSLLFCEGSVPFVPPE